MNKILHKVNKIILDWRYSLSIGLVFYFITLFLGSLGGIWESISMFTAIIGWLLFVGIILMILDLLKFIYKKISQ